MHDYFYKKYIFLKNIPKEKIHETKVKDKQEIQEIVEIVKERLPNQKVIMYLDDKSISCIKFENKNLLFYVFYNKKKNFELHETCKELICICNYFYYYMKKVFGKNKKINLIWVPLMICRDFFYDKNSNSIQNDINESENNFQAFSVSGKTFSNFRKKNNYCSIITRLEEIHKLCIHELLHQTKLDYSFSIKQDTLKLYETIKPKCNHHYYYSLIESYTELSSTYYNIMFQIYFIFWKDNFSYKKFKKIFKYCICLEIIYSTCIVLSLIKMNNYKSVSEFNMCPCFTGNISIYEYYYIKWLLFFSFDFTDKKHIYKRICEIQCIPKYLITILEHMYANTFIHNNYKYIYCTKENMKQIFLN